MPKTPEIPQDVFFEDKPPSARQGAVVSPPKASRRQGAKQSSSQKVQVTIYLSEQTAKDLEKARFELLNEHDIKVPKSTIAEYAIATVIRDIEAMARALTNGGDRGEVTCSPK